MMKSAPAFMACSCTAGPNSAPEIPSGKPGKLSIFSMLMMDAPPIIRSTMTVRSP